MGEPIGEDNGRNKGLKNKSIFIEIIIDTIVKKFPSIVLVWYWIEIKLGAVFYRLFYRNCREVSDKNEILNIKIFHIFDIYIRYFIEYKKDKQGSSQNKLAF